MIEIRTMKKNEAAEVRKLGKETFEWFESIFVPEPKKCYVALKDNEIIGAILYKYLTTANEKIAYVDYIFVDESWHGKGIGSKLLDHFLEKMEQSACDAYSAIIRDDNVGSWKLFVDRGLKKMGLDDLIKEFGLFGMFTLTMKTPFYLATGMDIYLKSENKDLSSNKENSSFQIIKYLLFTILLLLPAIFYGLTYAFNIIGAVILILAIRIIFGYIGTFFSSENWYFRYCDGGFLIPFIVSLFGGIYFISGNWYPKVYRKDKEFKRSLGLTALAQWTSLFLIVFLTRTQLGELEFFKIMASISSIFLLISSVPLYPLASFGGKRIFSWNKLIYIMVVFLAIYSVFFY